MTDTIGWVATALFAASYFFKQPATLRRMQAAAAGLWIIYGAVLHAMPVVAANAIVAGLALWSSLRAPTRNAPAPSAAGPEPAPGDG